MEEPSLSPAGVARILSIPEDEANSLARPDGRVPLSAVRDRAAGATLELTLELARELVRAREEVGRLSGRLGEVRATNPRLQKEAKDSVEERRRLTEEVLGLRAEAEERLMLMERIERIAGAEQELAQAEAELARLQNRNALGRLFDR